jgi:formate-dependent nitrite reductase cytochrome c552 subunit
MRRWTLTLAALLASPAAAAAAGHPVVDAPADPDACLSCHGEATPAIVKEWEDGEHGLMLVKCFVCHGSTGKDFMRRAAAGRCAACHPDAAASVTPPKGKAQDCFACHAPHGLDVRGGQSNPHTSR